MFRDQKREGEEALENQDGEEEEVVEAEKKEEEGVEDDFKDERGGVRGLLLGENEVLENPKGEEKV